MSHGVTFALSRGASELSLDFGEVMRDKPASPPAARYVPDQTYVPPGPYAPARIVREATIPNALEGFKTVAACSVSTYFAIHVTHYRNCVGVENPDWVERIGRRVIGELCYSGLIVASLVEAAARLILSIPFCLISLSLACYFYGWEHFVNVAEFLIRFIPVSALLSISNAASCAIALLRNLPERTLRYENLFPLTSFVIWDIFIHENIRSLHERERMDGEVGDWKNNDWNNAFHAGLA